MPLRLRFSATTLTLAGLALAGGCSQSTTPSSVPTSTPAAVAEAQPVPVAAPANPTPVTLAQALAIADLSTMPLPADAHRKEAKPFSFSYSAPVSEQRTVTASLAELTTQLTALGWQVATDPAPQSYDQGAISYFQKQGVWLIATLGQSRGFSPTDPRQEVGPDLNVGAIILGNIDPRRLPHPDSAEISSQDPSSISYTTPEDLLVVRQFYETALPRTGWRECIWQPLAGIEIPMETKERSQWFFQNGVRLDITLNREASGTKVFLRPELIQSELPIPADADDIELGDDPKYFFCETHLPLIEAVQFMRTGMESRGWQSADLPPNPAEKIAASLKFTTEGREPMRCEFLETEHYVLVQLKTDR